ncbi:MAG: protease modulator HflC [Gammaproteobacteria bacterium]|nr:protease modulator HflC [Gammaproteobacteria bacterium]
MKHWKRAITTIAVLLFLLLMGSLFVIEEGQKGLVLVMGKLKTDTQGLAKTYGPGLHVKLPFISSVKKFDTRLHGFTSGEFSTLTSKQTSVVVEYYVKWRISNLPLYYQRTSGIEERAESLMEQKINDELRAQLGKHTSGDFISTARPQILDAVLKNTQRALSDDYGVEILDVQIQSVKLPARVLASVFSRMAAERKQFANNKRAEGLKVSESIRAAADQQVVIIKAQALQEAATLKAQGEQKAAKLYADTYGKDAKFYNFYRSLLAYRASFKDKEDVLVLSPQGQFFDYFHSVDDKA